MPSSNNSDHAMGGGQAGAMAQQQQTEKPEHYRSVKLEVELN